jgi:hypothetical protein
MTMAAVESIPCPRCAAAPGEPCSSPAGDPLPTGHATRWFALFANTTPKQT